MIEEFEYTGRWWLPDNPEEKISGTLRFTLSEGTVLDLMDSFENIKSTNTEGSITKKVWTGKLFEPEIILGTSSDGKNITLHKCFETKRSDSSSGFSTSSFYANEVFIGAHFQNADAIKFKSISVHYLHLDEWVNISGFDIKPHANGDRVVIEYKLPEPVKACIHDDCTIHIVFKANGLSWSLVQKEVSIKQKTYIKIDSSEERSYEEYTKKIYHIQNFLTLGIMEPLYPLAIEGTTEANRVMRKDVIHYPPVDIFYTPIYIPTKAKPLLPQDMLFTFRDISEQFENFLQNWFGKAELLKPVYDLFFGTLYNPSMYLEFQFLSLIQAIESFHGRRYGGEYLSDEDYKVVYDALVTAIPDGGDLKDRLKEYLKYGNKFSLRTRLKKIFAGYQENLSEFIENKNAFIEKVVITRNYLTHYDEKLKEKVALGEELDPLIQKLKILLEICLLTELGFSSKKIKSLLSRNRRYQREYIQ